MEATPHNLPDAQTRGHEYHDIRLWPVLAGASAVIFLAAISYLASSATSGLGDHAPIIGKIFASPGPPAPWLEPEPDHPNTGPQDLESVRQREAAMLGAQNIGWVDPAHQFRRIPLDKAIDFAVNRGLPLVLPATMPSEGPFIPSSSARHGPGGAP